MNSKGTQLYIHLYPFSPKLPFHPGCLMTLWRGPYCCLVSKSCLTYWDPKDYCQRGFFVCGVSQARTLEWIAISSSRGLLTQGSSLSLLRWQADSLPLRPQGSPEFPIVSFWNKFISSQVFNYLILGSFFLLN